MADALLFAAGRESRSRAHVRGTFLLTLELLAPALLLGLWRVWSSAMAPKLGFYFTAEALLVAYAYYAVSRTAYVTVRSFDRTGSYSRALAVRAAQVFQRGARPYRFKLAIAFLALMLAALALDMLTAESGLQRRPNLHLTMLFLEAMIWARYGAAVVIAAARWSPPAAPAFAQAREMAWRAPVVRSFARANLGWGAVALAGVVAYKWGGTLLPTARAELFCAAGLFCSLAFLALWVQGRWARAIAYSLDERDAGAVSAPQLQRAA